MESYAWPGNVRELRNIVERLAILCDHERIEPQHLPAEIRQVAAATAGGAPLPRTWEEFKRLKQQVRDSAVQQLERRFLVEALERCERQRQPRRRGNRHPADQSARPDAEVRPDVRGVSADGRAYSVWPL